MTVKYKSTFSPRQQQQQQCLGKGEKVPHSPGQHCLGTDVSSAAQKCSTGLSFKCHAPDFISARHEDRSGYLGAHIAQLHCFEQTEGFWS